MCSLQWRVRQGNHCMWGQFVEHLDEGVVKEMSRALLSQPPAPPRFAGTGLSNCWETFYSRQGQPHNKSSWHQKTNLCKLFVRVSFYILCDHPTCSTIRCVRCSLCPVGRTDDNRVVTEQFHVWVCKLMSRAQKEARTGRHPRLGWHLTECGPRTHNSTPTPSLLFMMW